MRLSIVVTFLFALPALAEPEPLNMLTLPPEEEQPAVVEAPDTRSVCDQACDAAAASCYETCLTTALQAEASVARTTLTTCRQPCSEQQAGCRAACD